MPTDDQLLLAALAGTGREAALAECIRRFGPMVRRTAWRITGDEHSADDVCQAVFLVLLRKAASVARHPSPSAWIYYVTVTTARDAVKSKVRRQRREQEAVMVAQAQRKPLTRLPTGIDQAIVRLPEMYRRVLVAHYLEGHSHAEVAAQLGVSEEIVRKRASRGIERLRKCLAGTAVASGLAGLLSAEAAAAAPLAAAQVAAIQAAAAGSASVHVSALAGAATKALLWAKLKVYAAIMALTAVVAVPGYVLLKPSESSLVGHYRFDEGRSTQVTDSSATGNQGTLLGGVTWTVGPKPGSKALSFDGKTGYIKVDKDLNQWLGGTVTSAFWIRTRQANQGQDWLAPCVLASSAGTASDNDLGWGEIDATGRIRMAVGDKQPGAVQSIGSVRPVNDDRWHHVGMTRDADSGEVQVFIDGQLSARGKLKPGQKTMPIDNIGHWFHPDHRVHLFFQGDLSDLRIYRKVLTAEEIRRLAE